MDLTRTPNEVLDAVLAAARQSHCQPSGLSREAREILKGFLALSAEVRETLILDVFREKQARKARARLFHESLSPVWR
jgi:hypothetical protein